MRLQHLLIGINFGIQTDCQAIIHLNTQRTVNPQLTRWANLLTEFDFYIRHRLGENMAHVDALSHSPVEESQDTEKELLKGLFNILVTLTEKEHIISIQRTDIKLRKIIDILNHESSLLEQRKNKVKSRSTIWLMVCCTRMSS